MAEGAALIADLNDRWLAKLHAAGCANVPAPFVVPTTPNFLEQIEAAVKNAIPWILIAAALFLASKSGGRNE